MPIFALMGCTYTNESSSIGFTVYTLFLFFGGLILLVFCAFIIWLIWYFIRKPKEQSLEQNKDSKSLDIAKERYAKGEISKEEFEQIKKDLT
jgi:putative membrane protein